MKILLRILGLPFRIWIGLMFSFVLGLVACCDANLTFWAKPLWKWVWVGEGSWLDE
jgi:hypothetical protein